MLRYIYGDLCPFAPLLGPILILFYTLFNCEFMTICYFTSIREQIQFLLGQPIKEILMVVSNYKRWATMFFVCFIPFYSSQITWFMIFQLHVSIRVWRNHSSNLVVPIHAAWCFCLTRKSCKIFGLLDWRLSTCFLYSCNDSTNNFSLECPNILLS